MVGIESELQAALMLNRFESLGSTAPPVSDVNEVRLKSQWSEVKNHCSCTHT